MKKESDIEIVNDRWENVLPDLDDNSFDLAIVDPPYGKNVDNDKKTNFVTTKHKSKSWDKSPPPKWYFEELQRVSHNQIIWGGNYFNLPPSPCIVIWDKVNPMPVKFSDAEIAWTSFDKPTRIFKQPWIGFGRHFEEKEPSIHPTQKPIKLYRWLLKTFANEGGKILDTHLGSGSIGLACWEEGYDLLGMEIDTDYYNGALERLSEYKKQTSLPL